MITILEIFKDFFACKIVLAANHHYPGNIQRRFRLQKCLSRISIETQRIYSETTSNCVLVENELHRIEVILRQFQIVS